MDMNRHAPALPLQARSADGYARQWREQSVGCTESLATARHSDQFGKVRSSTRRNERQAVQQSGQCRLKKALRQIHETDSEARQLRRLNQLISQAMESVAAPRRLVSPTARSHMIGRSDYEHSQMMFVDDGEEDVAVAVWQYDSGLRKNETGRAIRLVGIYVKPQCQGRGIGSNLLEFVCNWGSLRGCADIVVATEPHCQSFFSRNSFIKQSFTNGANLRPREMSRQLS